MTLAGLLVRAEPVLRRVDRVAGGRAASLRIPEESRTAPATRRALLLVAWGLTAELVIAAAAVGFAVAIADTGESVPGIVWYRLVVILAITATLFYFLWRAGLGWVWAFSRLRLFSIVFPVVAIGTCLVPGLYPPWMIAEQILFSAVLVAVSLVLHRPAVRVAYAASAAAPTATARTPFPRPPTGPPTRSQSALGPRARR